MSTLSSLKVLLGLLGPYRRRYWMLLGLNAIPTMWSIVNFLAAMLVMASLSVSTPILGGSRTPAVEPGFLTKLLASYSAEQQLMLGICIASLSMFFATLTNLFLHEFKVRFLDVYVVYLQKLCFESMLTYRLSFHDRTKRGDLTQLVTIETREVRNVVKHSVSWVSSAVTFILYTALILYLSAFLTAAFSVLGVIVYLINRKLGQVNVKASEIALRERANTLSVVQEGLFGVRSIKSLLQGPWVLGRLEVHSAESNRQFSRSSTMQNLQGAVIELFGLISITGTMFLSFARPTLVTPSAALLFLYAANRLLTTIGSLIRAQGLLQSHMPSIAEVHNFLGLRSKEREVDGTLEKHPLLETSLRFEKVSLAYDTGKVVLDGIDLEIRRGERVGIVGASGVGKSTLAHLLLRFYETTSGRITIDGVPHTELKLDCLRRHIGLLSQEGFVFNMSIRENIAMGRPGASFEEIVEAARRAHAHEFIEEMPQKYDTVVGDRGVRLSGGQRQRLNIAQVFLKDPEILLLDEATSALDSESEARVQEAITSLSRNRTVLMIAHRLSTLKDTDRILFLEEGRIVEQGRWDELISARGRFARAWEMQAGSFQTTGAGAS